MEASYECKCFALYQIDLAYVTLTWVEARIETMSEAGTSQCVPQKYAKYLGVDVFIFVLECVRVAETLSRRKEQRRTSLRPY
jgi:hypothetical protein